MVFVCVCGCVCVSLNVFLLHSFTSSPIHLLQLRWINSNPSFTAFYRLFSFFSSNKNEKPLEHSSFLPFFSSSVNFYISFYVCSNHILYMPYKHYLCIENERFHFTHTALFNFLSLFSCHIYITYQTLKWTLKLTYKDHF